MKKIIHVHQQEIRKHHPALIIRTYKGSTHHVEVKILGPSRLVQSDLPDHCGARAWIETSAPVEADGVLIP